MAFIDNSVITIDAILTTKGRELLARGDGSFKITQFALADDEIDYTLYNPSHPSGSQYYGEAIQNMPLQQAYPSETQVMKYLLTTLPRGTSKLPILDLGTGGIVMKQGASLTITPQTLNYGAQTFENNGYTATISDVRLFNTFNGVGVTTDSAQQTNSTTTLGTNVSKTVVGTSINLVSTTVNTLFGTNDKLYATLTVVGRDSGARLSIPVTITKSI